MKTLQQRIETQIAEYRNRINELELEIVRERKDKVLASTSEYEYHNRQIAVASGKITTLNQAIADFDTLLNFAE